MLYLFSNLVMKCFYTRILMTHSISDVDIPDYKNVWL